MHGIWAQMSETKLIFEALESLTVLSWGNYLYPLNLIFLFIH